MKMPWWVYVCVVVVLLSLGFATGYQWRKGSEVTAARAETKEVKAQVRQDDADQKQQAVNLSDQLADAQLHSLALERQLQALQASNGKLREEITHVHLDAVPVPSIAGTCPDPFSGRVFQRLYDAAAQAQPPR